MRRKSIGELKLSGSKRATRARKDAEAASVAATPGVPDRPQGLAWASRRAWNALVEDLLARRVLTKADGPLLLELIQARSAIYKGGDTEAAKRRIEEIEAIFHSRAPFTVSPVPAPPEHLLEDFLADVQLERDSFSKRLRPGQTVCPENGQPFYGWPEDDAATVAREYCQKITQGNEGACVLLQRACARHLNDLETAHSRGLFFDPLAARNICTWFEHFCGLKLEPWEVWILTSLFGWKTAAGLRRFREAWISMGRKNGKTALAAGIGLFGLVADGVSFAEVYSAAVKKEQARLIFRDAVRYVEANSELKGYLRKFINSLAVERTDSVFQPLSSDTRSMDGLRPSMILADEVHEWGNREQWDKLAAGVVSRAQPLILAITTAGAAQSGFAFQKFEVAEKILNGILPDDQTFVAIYQLERNDDYRDERNWTKANPNLGITVQLEAFRKRLAEVEQDQSALNNFLRYQCNQWVSWKAGRSIPMDKIDACRGYPDLDHASPQALYDEFLAVNYSEDCFGGLDLGLLSDLTCYALLFPRVKMRSGEVLNKVVAICFFWMPEERLAEKERSWNVPLSQWAREGWIKLLPGDMTDPRLVRADIEDFCQRGPGRVQSIGYDPWQARVMMAELAETRLTECVEVPQKPGALTTPSREFKQAVWAGEFWHLGNPVVKWMFSNVALEENEKHGGMWPQKLSPNEKIDAVQAIVTAWHGLLNNN